MITKVALVALQLRARHLRLLAASGAGVRGPPHVALDGDAAARTARDARIRAPGQFGIIFDICRHHHRSHLQTNMFDRQLPPKSQCFPGIKAKRVSLLTEAPAQDVNIILMR